MNQTRWGDFDGSKHPFGDIPAEWTEVQKATDSHKSKGKEKEPIPKTSPSNRDELYARFMASIVDGLDEHTQKVIHERADKIKNANLNSEVNTDTTDTPKNTNMAHNDYTSTTKVIQVNMARDTGLLPDIFTLRRTTPGGDPKVPEAPKMVHNPIDQVPSTSYLAQHVRTVVNNDSDLSDAPASTTDSTHSNRSAKKAQKWKAY